MLIDYHDIVWGAMLERYQKTRAKADQHHAHLKHRFVDDEE